MVTKGLLHKDVYLPNKIQEVAGRLLKNYKTYTLSGHVKDHAVVDEDKSHGYTLPRLKEALDNAIGKAFEAFEVEVTQYDNKDGKTKSPWYVTKICIRVPYGDDQDVCLSIRPYRDYVTHRLDTANALIVTAWLNARNDNHTTLDSSKYLTQEECSQMGI